ncbi:MAG: hypothetical protein ACI4AA_07505 [Lachnospiraceae bacterium]
MERSYESSGKGENDVTNELQLLIESLEKKKTVLSDILNKSRLQGEIASTENFDVEKFDRLFDEKSELLQQMERLDQGFDAVYERIKDELLEKKDSYKDEIARLQKLISETIDLGAQIHATEARTKDSMSTALTNSRQELQKRRASSKSVMDYYKANSQLKYVEPFFMDQKK